MNSNNSLRVAVAGHPLSGKSIYAAALGLPHKSTDEALRLHRTWSKVSDIVELWFNDPGPWVISGVAVPRALRKWRYHHPGAKPPIDHFVFIERPSLTSLTASQRSMAYGINTVVDGLRPWLYPVFADPHELMFQLRSPVTFFESHRCWRCNSGAKPCAQRGYWRCEFPVARNH